MKLIKPYDDRLTYSGRIDFDDIKKPIFCYCGTNVRCRFYGTSVYAYINNTKNDWRNFLGYLIDDKQYSFELERDNVTHKIKLADNLENKWHDLLLFKRQDECHYFSFEGLEVEGNVEKIHLPLRKIEIIGDSISCGEVVEANDYIGKVDPEHHGEYSNAYYSYGWQLARMLEAEIHITSESGIALLDDTGYFNQIDENGRHAQGMESCFDKIEFNRNYDVYKDWDFSKYTPHVVIVALGQNDAHPIDYMKENFNNEKSIYWRKKYKDFIEKLMSLYPLATIILTTTILIHDSAWDRAIEEVCLDINSKRVKHYKYRRNGSGTPGHVRIEESKEMAAELFEYINSLSIEWS